MVVRVLRVLVVTGVSLVLALAEQSPKQTREAPGSSALSPSSSIVKVVAGIVGEDGTVRFLPRVKVKLVAPVSAEEREAANALYEKQVHELQKTRDEERIRLKQAGASVALSAALEAGVEQTAPLVNQKASVAAIESRFQAAAKAAREKFVAAAQRTITEGATSLHGELTMVAPLGRFTLLAEDTTTKLHYRWSIPVESNGEPITIELSDANAGQKEIQATIAPDKLREATPASSQPMANSLPSGATGPEKKPASAASRECQALPWPGPDIWHAIAHGNPSYYGGIDGTRTIYVQYGPTVPPEDRGLPSGALKYWKITCGEEADLRFFVRSVVADTDADQPMTVGGAILAGARRAQGARGPQELRFLGAACNQSGALIFWARGYSVQEVWNQLLWPMGERDKRLQREEKKRQKSLGKRNK